MSDGLGVWLSMSRKREGDGRYDCETKLAAVPDHPERGMSRPEVMGRHGIVSRTCLRQWRRDCRRGRAGDAASEAPGGQSEAEPDACIVHRNTRRRQIRPEGHTPEEFRNMSPTA